jgi:hypothetical protein
MSDALSEAFRLYPLREAGYRLTVIRKAASQYLRSSELYRNCDQAKQEIESHSPQWWLELSQSTPHGGDRRSLYAGSKTTPIRVPIEMKPLFIALAKKASTDPQLLKKLQEL